jgi:D-alanyl-lipoteichoic acid acyltransferase DltB (MBOAT superfamily)
VIADSLAYFALDAAHADQANSAGALCSCSTLTPSALYFDFSGYSDIAIGIGQLYGIKLRRTSTSPISSATLRLLAELAHHIK